MEQAVALSNAVAPEHLELCVRSPKSLLKGIKHAGAVFLGSLSTEPFGDYVSGPSHVLPTGGAARFSSPLSVYDFLRMPSTISMSKKRLFVSRWGRYEPCPRRGAFRPCVFGKKTD